MSEIVIERPPAFAPSQLRQAYGCFPSGVLALCGIQSGEQPQGMAVSAFVAVSLEPALVQVCIQRTSATWPILKALPRLGLSVLAEEHGTVARTLASKNGDRFNGVEWESRDNGAVFVHGSTLWLEATLETEYVVGDHVICLLRIWTIESHPDVTPLVYHGSKFRLLQPEHH
jgi:flavin reductase (DIM6/NTAB) family NADH-FMN oxidoreductase RutF